YFNKDAIIESRLNLIMIPENIESKFINKGFCVIRKGDIYKLTDLSELIIAGDDTAFRRLGRFQNELEVKSFSKAEIDRIAIVIKTFEEIESITNLKKIISLAHVVSEFSPDENCGVEFKSKLVEKLNSLIEYCETADLFLLKKFPLKSFLHSKDEFTKSVIKWIIENLYSTEVTKNNNLKIIFTPLSEVPDSNWLSQLIRNEIIEFLAGITPDKALIIVKWLKQDSEIFCFIRDRIEASKKAEDSFAFAFGSESDKDCLLFIQEFAIERKWYCLYADTLMYQYTPEQAIQKLLNVDKDSNSFEALERITNNLASNLVIDMAVLLGENRLVELAGRLCYANPLLIEKIDISNIHWRAIWISSLTKGSKITDGLKDPKTVIYSLFDNCVDGLKVDELLFYKIIYTEFANILEYEFREKMWEIIPIKIKEEFLSKTSFFLLNKLCLDSNVEVPKEKVLLDYINSYAIPEYIKNRQCNIRGILRIYFVFNLKAEKELREYLNYYNEDIDVIDAAQLGKLTIENNYTEVAYIVLSKARYFQSWRIALEECYHLLGWLSKAEIYITGLVKNIQITEDQWWEAFAEIVYRLYPGGPKENKIWMEAEGEEYDIQTIGSGKSLWIASLKNLRSGDCTGITIEKLLKKMMKTFKNNSELKTLNDLKSKL
ncbi:effector-associated domain EAD1-containing protein, partial [Leptospira interrogans]